MDDALVKDSNANGPISYNGTDVGTIADDIANTKTDRIIRKLHLDILG